MAPFDTAWSMANGMDAKQRADWGLFRDRRPDLYRTLLTVDGSTSGA